MAIIITLDEVLTKRQMSLTELAELVQRSLANVSKIKTGKSKAMLFSTLSAICETLECQPGELLRLENVKISENADGRHC